jgi:hypothetical protein
MVLKRLLKQLSLLKLTLLLMAGFLLACTSSSPYLLQHALYNPNKKPIQEISSAGFKNILVIRIPERLERNLGFTLDAQIDSVEKWINSSLETNSSTFGRSHLSYKNNISFNSFNQLPPEEKWKISENIYINGQFPAQGQEILSTDGQKPPFILLWHEATLGTDLNIQELYDYRDANAREASSAPKYPKELTLLVAWTIWDNHRQNIALAGISKASVTLPDPIKREHIEILSKQINVKIAQTILQTP